jgi:membrane protein implicated in regulation of membrane protease activity
MDPISMIVLVVIVSVISIYLDRRYIRSRKKSKEEENGSN